MSIDSYIYAYLAKEEHHQDKDYIITEGSKGNWIYIVLEGKVKVKKKTPKGLVTINTLREGDVFGEMVLWQAGEGGERTSSVVADGPVVLGLLDPERIIKEYEPISPRLKTLLKALVIRLDETTRRAALLAVDSP